MRVHLVASVTQRYLDKIGEAWMYVGDMSRERALKLLGFGPTASPTEEEIHLAHRKMMVSEGVHPDRGGRHERAVEVNLAKDFLLKKQPPVMDRSAPPRPRAEPKPVVDTVKGTSFSSAAAGVPQAEWLFISKPEWVSYQDSRSHSGWSSDMWLVVGKGEGGELTVLGLQHRKANTVFDADKDGRVEIEPSWDIVHHRIAGGFDPIKALPKAFKVVASSFKDGFAPRKVPQKFVAWPGGDLSETTVGSVKMGSGGANLKDILLTSGLLDEGHASLQGRKSNVEITPKYNLERIKQLRKERAPKPVYSWEAFDFYVSVNGKHPEKLSNETVHNLEKKGFIFGVFGYDPHDGVPKNLAKMRGGKLGLTGGDVIHLLVKCLTTESNQLVEALLKAASEWPDPFAGKEASVSLADASFVARWR